jgi:hypothetical protein
MAHQEALTIIGDIKPEAMDSLQQLLHAMSEDAASNEVIPFERLNNLHFARLLILPESRDLKGEIIGPKLVLSTNVDAPLKAHLNELVDVVGNGLDEIFGHPTGSVTRESRLAYLRSHTVEAQAFYVNTVGRTVKQVRREAWLRNAIEDFLDRHDWSGRDSLEIREAIQHFVDNEPSLGWAKEPPERPEVG